MEDGWMTEFRVVGPPPVRSIKVYGTISGDRRLMYAAKWKSSLGQNGGLCDDGQMVIERNRKFGCPPAGKPISIDIEVETQDCVCAIYTEKAGTPKLCWGTLIADATVTETKPLTPPFTGTAPQVNVTMIMNVKNHPVPDATVTLQGEWEQPTPYDIRFTPEGSEHSAGGLQQMQDFLDKAVKPYLNGTSTSQSMDCSAGILKLTPAFKSTIIASTDKTGASRVPCDIIPLEWTCGATVGLYVSDATKCDDEYRGRKVDIGVSSADVIPKIASAKFDNGDFEGQIVLTMIQGVTIDLPVVVDPPEPPYKPKGKYSSAQVISTSIEQWERKNSFPRGNLAFIAVCMTRFNLTVS
jgi:hypothetical protein